MSTPQLDLPPMEPVEPVDPPKRGPGRPRKAAADKAPRTATPKPRVASLEARLTGSLTTVGAVVGMVSMPDGLVLVEGAPPLAAALAKLAQENPAVKQGLERMLTAGAWSAVIAAAVPIAAGIAANHGMIPPEFAGALKQQQQGGNPAGD